MAACKVSAKLEAHDKFQLTCPTINLTNIRFRDSRVASCAEQAEGRAGNLLALRTDGTLLQTKMLSKN
jgi:hypothetical protein